MSIPPSSIGASGGTDHISGSAAGPEKPHPVRRKYPRTLWVSSSIILAAVLLSIAGPAIAPYGPTEIDGAQALSGPSLDHWLGADNLGRDLFARATAAYRISVAVALGSVLLALAVGVPLGLIAGYSRQLTDNLVMRPLDVLMAFPAVLLAIMVMTVLGTGTVVLTVAIAIVYVPIITRLMRASALATSRELYVVAARARGASYLRVVARHILPNSVGPVIVQAALLMGIAIILEAALSFVGLGVRPPTPALGLMLADGRDFMASSAWVVAVPGVAIMIVVLAFNTLGDSLSDVLDPKHRVKG